MSIDPIRPPLFVRLRQDIVAALGYVLADDPTSFRADPQLEPRTWPLVPLGLGLGLLWVGTFRATWRLFGEVSNLRLIPSFAVVVVFALVTGRSMLRAAMRLAESPRFPGCAENQPTPIRETSLVLVTLFLLGLFVFVLSIQELRGWWPATDDWRSWFNWMYPRPIYRPLILAPLWGQWGIIVALCTGRVAPTADSLTRTYNHDLSAFKLVVHSALPLGLSCIYLTREGRYFTGPMIAALLLALTILFSTVVANLRRGQSRTTILSTGLFAQFMFIVLYRAFWPLIER